MKTTAQTSDTQHGAAVLETHRRSLRLLAREYLELTKPRVVSLIVFTAVVGMFLATPGMCRCRRSSRAPSASR